MHNILYKFINSLLDCRLAQLEKGGSDNSNSSIGVSKEIRDRFTQANTQKNASLFLGLLLDVWEQREDIILIGLKKSREYITTDKAS